MKSATAQRAAVIDLGSNTARLVLIYFRRAYAYHLEDEIREVVRLREGLTDSGLAEKAVRRALSTLALFKQYCAAIGPDMVVAVATSAVRDAANGSDFVQRVREEIGLDLRILSGEEEAFYGCLGALNSVPLEDGAVMDTGGGSVQLSVVQEGRFQQGWAFSLGALTLTEQFALSDPIKKAEIKLIRDEIERRLDEFPGWKKAGGTQLVGLGGTTRNLAKIQAKRQGFPIDQMNGFVMRRNSIDKIVKTLQQLPLRARKKIPGLSHDRADIILPGALVVHAVMERLGVDELTLSTYGIREGLFLEGFWNHAPSANTAPSVQAPPLRDFSVLNAARFYNYQEQHAHHIRYLCRRLFDQLIPLHGYGSAERALLDAAALLHDIGTVISYNDHHKHSQMLILNHGLPGFSARELVIIALLARYHRKGIPSCGGYASLLRKNDKTCVERLAALLRLAECLERRRSSHIKDIQVSWNDKELILTLMASGEPTVEIWDAQRLAVDLLEAVYDRSVSLKSEVQASGGQ